MAEGRNIQGGVGSSGLRWWQQGSTEKKPTYFSKNAAGVFWQKQAPLIKRATKYYNHQEQLISDRNDFFKSYNAALSEPKYSFSDAMRLSNYGYTGLFGRSESKQTLGLLGEEWQRAYALDRLRKGKDMLTFSLMANAPTQVLKDTAAATMIIPGSQKYNSLAGLYIGFGDKYGVNGEKYAERYGHVPTVGSKYGILFNTDNKKIRKDDVNATYQNNLARASVLAGKSLIEAGTKNNNDALKALGLQYTAYGDYKLKSSRAQYNPDKTAEMEQALKDYNQLSGDVAKALGGGDNSVSSFERFASGYLGFLASANPMGVALTQFGPGKDLTKKALDYMNGLSDSDVLKAKPIYWTNLNKPFSQTGFIGLAGNVARGVARMGLGLPAGMGMLADEAYLAGKETAKWTTNDNYTWGQNVDFKIGDAMWKDYANRYYDPFAVDAKGKGRSWWQGLNDPSSYDRVGDKIGNDPAAYVLDALDVAPVVGWGAKAAGLAGIAARTGRIVGRVGLTAEDTVALKAARVRAADGAFTDYTAEEIKSAQDLVDTLAGKPYLIDTVDQKVLEDAARIVSDQSAREELAVIQSKFDQAPSARTFRKTARAAYNGDELAAQELSRWRALGYDFNGAERSWGVKAGALFEPRTTVLAKPESVLEAAPNAVYRLPASPIMRGLKEAFFWVGRGVDKATIGAAEKGGVTGRVGTKLIDMPLLSYRYNYTKAVRNSAADLWGDINTEMQRASRLISIDNEAGLTPTMARAVEGHLMGGEGERPLQYPAIQRQQVQDKIDALPRDKRGDVIPAARGDLANLQKQLSELLDREITNVQDAAASFDEKFNQDLTDLRMRLADSTYKADDVQLDKAVDLYRRLDRQDQAVRSRIVHEDTSPTSVEHLKLLYTEAMDGLRLSATHLFGAKGSAGRVGKFAGKVLRVNTNMLLRGLAKRGDRESIIALAQHPTQEGTIFESIADPALRKLREDQMVQAFDALDRAGMFVDGLGSYGTPGRPVLVQASEKVGSDFVAFHIPTLRHEMSAGKVINGKIIDTNETFVLPKVLFAAKKKGLGAVIVEPTSHGRKLLYEGALNAMSSVYPRARFYSEKLNDTGLRGTRANEQMIANEHQVALTGMRQHALSRIIQSQVHYLRSRVERDLRTLAEGQAVLVPARQVVGKTAKESGYHVLHNVRVFDNASDALDFARLRGVGKDAEAALAAYADGTLEPIQTTMDLAQGLGVRMVKGKPEYIVRGGTHDWLNEAIQEDITKHSTTSEWISREFSDPSEIPDNGMVLAVPDQAFKDLAQMTIESDNLSTRLLNATAVKGWGNLFKWFVLNANPGFISNNVIGGMAMMLMMNPSASGRLLASMVQKMARESIRKGINNDWFTNQLSHFKYDSEAVSRQLAYEFEHNIYKQDAGLMGSVQGVPWYKKYVWHGGYTTVAAWEEMMRRNVAMQFLRKDSGFQSFMRGPEVKAYIEKNVDWHGNVRAADEPITPFEAATDLLLDPSSPFFNPKLKHRMRYMTNTVSGNYHRFNPTEQLMRNVVMPFYAWQRHSATFSYRMMVDRPITTNVLYNLGQQGYQQNAEQGLPDWMMQTLPAPQVIKDMFGIEDSTFRIDGNALSPFGTTGDMGMAAFSLLTGAKSYNNLFEFTNPYMNTLIQDTLGVNPQTGAIDWKRLTKDGTSAGGLFGMGKDMFTNVYKATYPYKLTELAKYQEYQADALNNKYAAVENASDILKNYDPSNPKDPWRLSIPQMKKAEVQDPTQRLFNAFGIKTYRTNPTMLPMSGRRDAVGAIVMKYINDNENASSASKAVKAAQTWQQRYDYVMQVWLPAAQKQGIDPAQIEMVLRKIRDEKPKTGIAKRLTSMGG